jgi:hypothetical protein
MTVTPGRYYVMAYARGISGMEIVNAGYTGLYPSCGQPLAIVTVAPNSQVTDIDINDWQQTCSGTAFRPDKPSDVPLP